MKLLDILKESQESEYPKAVFTSDMTLNQLIDLSKQGKLSPDDIRDITSQLTKARKQHFVGQISPEQRQSSVEKGKITNILNKSIKKAEDEVSKQLKLRDSDGKLSGDQPADIYALQSNWHQNKNLQKKWNSMVRDLTKKYAKLDGITDEKIIDDYWKLNK